MRLEAHGIRRRRDDRCNRRGRGGPAAQWANGYRHADPQPARIDLGGPIVSTLTYGNTIPGPLIRATVGDEIVVSVTNRLGDPTSVHWHGIALRNDMDGTEPATANIGPGGDFTYRFSVPDPGTYWAHPHVGLQGDHGLYLPVVVDDPTEPGHYDAEWIIILDDWTDGIGKSPQQLYGELTDPNKPTMQNTTGMPEGEGVDSNLLGGDGGDIAYPYYLINGRIPWRPRLLRPSLASESGSASSTAPPTPRSASRWPGIR